MKTKIGCLTVGTLMACWVASLLSQPTQAAQGASVPQQSVPIPLDQLGAVATKQVEGDSLSITAAENGARLKCAFQRLEGRATPEGLWLRSTTEGANSERFRLVAVSVGRQNKVGQCAPPVSKQVDEKRHDQSASPWTGQESAAMEFLRQEGTGGTRCPTWLPTTGTVSVTDQLVRYIRPGVTEEYSVSVDGVRQDFVVLEPPTLSPAGGEGQGEGTLRVELALGGASAEPTAYGAKLTLEGSGRTLAYSRLRTTDATGKELSARMEVLKSNSESRKQKAETSQGLLTGLRLATPRRAATAASARLVVLVDDTDAVYPIRIDPTFSDADWVSLNPGIAGANDNVNAIVAETSGNVYVGGRFTFIGSVPAHYVAKWDGSQWSALGEGVGHVPGWANPEVLALALHGSILYVGGMFTTAGGELADHIAKWDGTAWSTLGSGMGGGGIPRVSALAMIGTNLYAGGGFTTAGGVTVNHIAKWNGSSWSALRSGVSGNVYALGVNGTNLYVGGWFTTADGTAANLIAKWNGNSWSTLGSGIGGGYSPIVRALAVVGTDLYAGGHFDTAGGISASNIAKWNGSTWSALGSGVVDEVQALAASGSDLYAGGAFWTAGGATANGVAKWNGSTWSGLGSGMGMHVYALAVVGTNLYAGGGFNTVGDLPADNIARWDGDSWSALGSGIGGGWFNPAVEALAVMGTNLYAAGSFAIIDDAPANSIAKWDGDSWSALGSGVTWYEPLMQAELGARVNALAVSGTDLYVGGGFNRAGGVSANHIARWNGSSWSALGSGMNNDVYALAVIGTDLYAGGSFSTAGGVTAAGIAKWDGSVWSALGAGLGPLPEVRLIVKALTVSGADLYAGGLFGTAGGIPATDIAKWNGTSWSALGSGIKGGMGASGYGSVGVLAVIGADLYAGGGFTTAGEVAATNIAKWDGSTWSALGAGLGSSVWEPVNALAVVGTDLYAGGDFTTAGGIPANRIAKWDGSGWSTLNSGLNGRVSALATHNSGRLFVGGDFTVAGTTVSPFIVEADLVGLDLVWATIPSPQEAGVPVPVTLTARSYAGAILTNFTDTVSLSGYAPGLASTNVSIGTGTDSWIYPLHTSYHDARTQVIYLTNELGRACTLNSLALEITAPPGQALENWTIRMKHTALAEYPASPSWEGSGWTVVYQANEPAGSTGWRAFEFSTPFVYDGISNLLIDFSFNNDSYSAAGQCQSTIMGAYRSITHASDSKDGDPLTWSGTTPAPVRSYNVPNLVLGTSYADLLPVSLSPTVTTPFVNGVWTGEVTVHEAVTNLVLQASAGLGHEGESNPFDVLAPQAPVIVTDDGQLGLSGGIFGFNVTGPVGQAVVVEVSTNLVDWLPLQTNILSGVPWYFSDADTANFTQRFYRAITPR